jgi:CxxC motif-containing protein
MSENTAERTLLCIVCPEGCELVVQEKDGELVFKTHACKRGKEYARQELTDPRRILTTTIRVGHGAIPMLPVKTAAPIPKGTLMDAMACISRLDVEAPVTMGQVICPDVAHTGTALVACRNVPVGNAPA